ncbi:MAG: hypothetical protein EOO88_32455 [Pedobacter sp.]|nr:MAG: hypothetical protein EOO88_32455 [Pedobacter sp.]
MKNKSITAAIAACLLLTTSAFAQVRPEPREPKGPGPEREMLQEVTAFTGTVGNFVYNDDYVYDGFVLKGSSATDTVKFGPAMGAQIRNAVKEGSKVTVNGVARTNPEGVRHIRLVSITANGNSISVTPPTPPAVPVTETTLSGSGKITALLKGKRGETNGFMVDGNTILRFPPRTAEQLSEKVAVGNQISYSGALKAANSNEVAAKQMRIIHCSTITINGTQYLTR